MTCETAADGTFGIEYDSFGRITKLPGAYAGGKTLETSFYSNEMLAKQSQGGITNRYWLDATGLVREGKRADSMLMSGVPPL